MTTREFWSKMTLIDPLGRFTYKEMRDFRTRQKLGKGQHSSLMRNKTRGGSIESNQTRFIWNVDIYNDGRF